VGGAVDQRWPDTDDAANSVEHAAALASLAQRKGQALDRADSTARVPTCFKRTSFWHIFWQTSQLNRDPQDVQCISPDEHDHGAARAFRARITPNRSPRLVYKMCHVLRTAAVDVTIDRSRGGGLGHHTRCDLDVSLSDFRRGFSECSI
jgi:hypothetical protein